MENFIIKRTADRRTGKSGKYESVEDIRNLLKYVMTDKNTKQAVKYSGARGLVKDVDTAAEIIDIMQKYRGQAKGRRMYHFMLGFPLEVDDLHLVYIIAEKIADYIGQEYQLLYGIHTDREHLHIHMAVNAVNYMTGKKWHKNKKEFQEWKKKLIAIANEVEKEYRVV